MKVVEPTRSERGCRGINIFESLRAPISFAIHSEWADEAAFDLHATLPHTVRFIQAAERLTGQPIRGLRTREIVPTQQ